MKNKHELIEKNVGLFTILVLVAISFGAMTQIIPLMFQQKTAEPVKNLRPYTALEMEGRDIYIREGCSGCHSQMIRPFRAETERYGEYSVIGEHVWERPFLWGSKRTGPDLARVGGRYSDEWHRLHLLNPRAVVPESNMPAYPWLDKNTLSGKNTAKKLEIHRMLGVPYKDEDIRGAEDAVKGKTEMQALIAYLQVLGTFL